MSRPTPEGHMGFSRETIVGRETELASVSGFLDASDPDARVLLLEGEPGIGKTTLWRAGVDEARDRGHRVMRCQPAEIRTLTAATADNEEGNVHAMVAADEHRRRPVLSQVFDTNDLHPSGAALRLEQGVARADTALELDAD